MNNRQWTTLDRHVIYTCKPTCAACTLLMYINNVVLDWIMEYRPLIYAAQMATNLSLTIVWMELLDHENWADNSDSYCVMSQVVCESAE